MTGRPWGFAIAHVMVTAAVCAVGIVFVGWVALAAFYAAGRGTAAVIVAGGLALIGVAAAGTDFVTGPARFDPATWWWTGFTVGVAGAVLAAPFIAVVGDQLLWRTPGSAAVTVLAGGVPSMVLNGLRWRGVWVRQG